jgi:hypothetical protein
MTFGYEYLMVYLPEVCPNSFLLFVHNPAGSTKLRDYSGGAERQLKIYVTVAEVTAKTTFGRTRFSYEPYRTDEDGVGYPCLASPARQHGIWGDIYRRIAWLPVT